MLLCLRGSPLFEVGLQLIPGLSWKDQTVVGRGFEDQGYAGGRELVCVLIQVSAGRVARYLERQRPDLVTEAPCRPVATFSSGYVLDVRSKQSPIPSPPSLQGSYNACCERARLCDLRCGV